MTPVMSSVLANQICYGSGGWLHGRSSEGSFEARACDSWGLHYSFGSQVFTLEKRGKVLFYGPAIFQTMTRALS